ncbi:metal ABC transporter permease [Dactylosporangium sp. CS-047395]|uniref:metal ABC transporter permease n=1 Tax=Dactylosporangium sp. CS-047395 TaxID=3239936 RepID=UPI003D8AAEBB
MLLGLTLMWRPLSFASNDSDLAAARGVPVGLLLSLFMLLLGLAVAMSVQIVGALLVLSILVAPAAAAMRVSATPAVVTLLSVVFAIGSTVGGMLLALGGSSRSARTSSPPSRSPSTWSAASSLPASRADVHDGRLLHEFASQHVLIMPLAIALPRSTWDMSRFLTGPARGMLSTSAAAVQRQ